MILWESLGTEDQKKCLTELQNDANWVIWCKAKPKDMATQIFREYSKCTFEGKRAKPKQAGDNQAEALGAGMSPGPELVETGGCRRMRSSN